MNADKLKADEEFNKLCEDTYEKLKIKVYAKTGDKYAAEEIMQETYLIAGKNKKKLLSHPNPEGWLYKTAVYIHANNIRKNKKLENNETELSEELIVEFDSNENGADLAEEILSSLSEKDRVLVKMRYYDGLSLKEIADEKNMNYEALQKYFHRLIQKIKMNVL